MVDAQHVYDLIGIGFGPANLALAIALREHAESSEKSLNVHFLERQPSFGWHTSLLVPGSTLQVSPLKDLATMRNPTSTYSFTNYLHQQGRLAAFINREEDVPSRREWSAYLTWAAKRMDDVVSYGQDVVGVEPVKTAELLGQKTLGVSGAHNVKLLRITSRLRGSDKVTVRYARNITVAVGGIPRIPDAFKGIFPASPWTEASPVVHSSTFLPSLSALEIALSTRAAERTGRESPSYTSWPLNVGVIGSGQSSAEMALYLCRTFPSARVTMVFRSSAMVPSDDSSFVNSAAFDPERTDTFWRSGAKERDEWLREFKRTNYSVVRYDVLNSLNEISYSQKIELDAPWPGADGPMGGRFEIVANTVVEEAKFKEGSEEAGVPQVELTTTNTKDVTDPPRQRTFDAVFLGSGFERSVRSMRFLDPLAQYLPALDANAEQRKAELGFGGEVEDEATLLAATNTDADGHALERLRERTRDVTRDYRLVPYASSAYSARAADGSPTAAAGDAGRRSSTSSRGSSPHSSSTTLNGDAADAVTAAASEGLSDGFEPAVYALGGNERTHGLSDSLLSIVAWRAGELTESLLKRLAMQKPTLSSAASAAAAAATSSAVVTKGGDRAELDAAAKPLAGVTMTTNPSKAAGFPRSGGADVTTPTVEKMAQLSI